ncbi:MAG: hypothetical protein JST33_05755 [Actinobacteria bacterium]|nr:hypothetical protein [Actinomycetota bacterium]
MPLLEQVRELGAAEVHVEEDTIRVARAALMQEIARGGRAKDPVRTRRRRWTGIGVGGLVAGVAATAIVVGSVLAPPATPSASAAEVLNKAADRAVLHEFTLHPGEYIRIQEVSTQRLWWTRDGSRPEGGGWSVNPSETEATVRASQSLYVPAERSGDWVEDYAESFQVTAISGPDADKARPYLDSIAPRHNEVYPGGTFTQPDATDPTTRFSRDWMQPYYDVMPRDPEKLIEWMKRQEGGALTRFGEPVDVDLAPVDLRAAIFRALALIPGAEVTKVEGDVTTIVYPDGGESNWPQTVLVDTRQGLLVGRGGGDTDTASSRIFVTIVDKLPDSVKPPEK